MEGSKAIITQHNNLAKRESFFENITEISLNNLSMTTILGVFLTTGLLSVAYKSRTSNDDLITARRILKSYPNLRKKRELPFTILKSTKLEDLISLKYVSRAPIKKSDLVNIFFDLRLEAKRWLLSQKSELRTKRLRILSDQGMDQYIKVIREQSELEKEKMQSIALMLFSTETLHDLSAQYFWEFIKKEEKNEDFKVKLQSQNDEWNREKLKVLKQKLEDSKVKITEEVLEEMSSYSQEKQVRMFKQIMRKTSQEEDMGVFRKELEVTEVCKMDDFYQTFGFDEDEVRAYVELQNLN